LELEMELHNAYDLVKAQEAGEEVPLEEQLRIISERNVLGDIQTGMLLEQAEEDALRRKEEELKRGRLHRVVAIGQWLGVIRRV
jgi:hypothetical protein